ncbi:transglutaminase TgpA family protein [Parachitinimonas caeni]|uniref:DUF3488 and DUF4129 domain-containing transglutaminase family protein n=1 Tax=Parachitinimonas caeni TaxID=3031301 RepID=A0ABT7DUD2_9NEIS|nr:DUF3488 and DUF4129 domain-containing transglutaminase family protein [Parachitinimonas caeni]MDK2123641.1 DUF3488 and DUF4129 domain-containing transglutaminase family protein [Parachitinimonas caeni]
MREGEIQLNRANLASLIAVLALLIVPHGDHLPWWLIGVLGLLFSWRLFLISIQGRLPPSWLLLPFTVSLIIGVYVEFKTLFGRTGGVALLSVLIGLKLMETRGRRDALLLVFLGYFLVVTNFLFSQSFAMAVYLLLIVTVITALLVGWNSVGWNRLEGFSPLTHLVTAGKLLLQAVPLMVLLFVFFPRIEGPLWRLPQDRSSAKGGLADSMSPGSFSNLSQSDEVAFRVEFLGTVPPHGALYWRGPVFEQYDGTTWSQIPLGSEPPAPVEGIGPAVQYQLTLEPHQRPWLLALDAPAQSPGNGRISDRMQAVANGPVVKRDRYALASWLDYRMGKQQATLMLQRSLLLPRGNPKARALAAGWKALPPAQRVTAALAYYDSQPFTYTLQPPLYQGDAIDRFLFEGRQGFCEHYAGSFVFLMRAAGVPARVVGGYQGGELNPAGNYLIVRQADAHAWAEVWLEGRGWQRIDPTATVAPDRVDLGLARSVAQSESLPMMVRVDANWLRGVRLGLDAAVNAWNQWIIGYTPDQQMKLLRQLGISNLASYQFVAWFLGMIMAMTLPLAAWLLWHLRGPNPPPEVKAWRSFCHKLEKAGVEVRPSEPPLALSQRACAALPEHAEAIATIIGQYLALRYLGEASAEGIVQLKQQIAAFKPRRT